MIHERALVLEKRASQPESVWVRTQRQSACESCKMKSGCGQSALSKLTGERSMELEVVNSLNAKVGDVVILAIPEDGILTASLVMYFVPLLLMVLAAMLAVSFGLNEIMIILSGILGLALGFGFARRYSQNHKDDPRFSPSMSGLALSASTESSCT